ncbi:MAG: aminotransferase class I/II-fold pyridoxal phosphate-dependent enzyme [Acidobacteria bacterium]|nr:MAG: aminotransferase class I/II-fold pyridoxal phosphate-dependent enzyme [Acidobacteriota bacterium]
MDGIRTDYTLELQSEEMDHLVAQAMERIKSFIDTLPDQPSADVGGGEALARSLREAIPTGPTPFAEILDLLFDCLIPKTFNTAGPGYLAYIPGGGILHTAVADLIADSVNRYVGVWAAAPALAQLEVNVGRWFCDIVSYPAESLGLLTSGGSMSNLIAIVTARRNRLPDNFFSGTLYTSDQTHYSVSKAAVLAGLPPSNLRVVSSDNLFRINLTDLRDQIRRDRDAGMTPFLIVGNGGTTNTGAVDDLSALADLAREEGLWLHVDAAYGGFFMLTEKGRDAMRGIERADSITLDPHKGLFLPYGTGSLLVRDGSALRKAHSVRAVYLPPTEHEPDLVDLSQVSPELSRAFRGLRVWLPLKMHGIEPFRQNLEEKLQLAQWITEKLRAIDEIEIVAEPQLTVLAFRLRLPGKDEETTDRLTRRFMDEVNERRRVYLSSTVIEGRFLVRICVLSFRTHLERMQMALEDIKAAVKAITATD